MSNGGGEIGREHEGLSTHRKLGGNDFSQAVARVAVAQVCEGEGFQAFQQSALETLSDVAVRYIWNIGKNAQYHANIAGRNECNVFDVIQGLEDLGSAQGFAGASDIDRCLKSSGIVREMVQYVYESEHIPFVHLIPHFPVTKERTVTPSFVKIGQEPPGDHIPSWLPAFPDPQTYGQSSMSNGRAVEPHRPECIQESKRVKGEPSWMSFHQQVVSNVHERPSLVDPVDAKGKKVAVESNPFLAPPLHFGEKEVSFLAPPANLSDNVKIEKPVMENHIEDNHVSVLETFAPAIEAIKSRIYDSEDRQADALLSRRSSVQFKIKGIGKRFGRILDLSSHKKEGDNIPSLSGIENEKDDKKKRAEKILKESLANPNEFAQL